MANPSIKLLLEESGHEVHKTKKAYKEAKGLYANYNKRILRSSNIVQNTFTLHNIMMAYYNYNNVMVKIKNSPKGKVKIPCYNLLSCPCFLLIAYSSLKKRSGYGIDNVPVDNITLANILSFSKTLINHTYKPNPTNRIYIPKANGKMRPLGIASSRDKIVQQAVYLIIEPLFESQFSELSHGFRPKKSCHSALKYINKV